MPDLPSDILLVENDEAARAEKTRVLRQAGLKVTAVSDGASALKLIKERSFDLVILKVILPDMSGLEVCRKIKEHAPDLMVLQTSSRLVTSNDRVVGFDQGADGYLIEPVEHAEFIAEVRALLRIKQAERQRAEAEAMLAHALEASNIAAWEWDLRENRSTASRGMWQLLGLAAEELVEGTPWETFVLPEDRPLLDAALAEAIEKHQLLDVEFRIRREDGEVRWLAARGRFIAENAHAPRMIGVNLDITERKRAEEHAAHLAAIVAQSADGIISYDLDHRIHSWNHGAEVMFGYTAEEVIGKTAVSTIVPPERVDESLELLGEVGAGKSLSIETQRRRKDGTLIEVSITAAPIRDREGRTVGKSAIVRDMTDRIQSERALFAAQQRLEAVLEAAPIGISFTNDPSCECLTVNPAQLRQYGGKPGDNLSAEAADEHAFGRQIRYWKDGRQLRPEELPLQRAVAENRVIESFEVDVELPDGRRWTAESSAAPIRGRNGEVVAGVVVVADITHRKRAEEHIKLLMAETNHRAKNLLSVVQGIARLTAPAADPETFADRLSQRLRALAINQELLVQTNWHGVDFKDLARSQLEPFKGRAATRVQLKGPHVLVSAAAAQAIGMALHELATNAAKYGALSQPEGRLDLKWELTGSGPERQFRIRWCERGGPSVRQPKRRGFGHKVIVDMVEFALGGDVRLAYKEEGVIWAVNAPAARVLEQGVDFMRLHY